MSAPEHIDLAGQNVSRETQERLQVFADLVEKWNPRINLVSRNSLVHLWGRHIIDSIQIFQCTPPAAHWLDLGSGGGFPGVVVAILAADAAPEMDVTLVESDQRKAAFLRTAIRETGVRGRVRAERIETLDPQNATILSARALADLTGLLGFCERHLDSNGTALFPKGVTWKEEVAEARKNWSFDMEKVDSKTMDGSVILKISGVSRA
ncbi:16S rRNA (guanine(527)-N(7))-methyltransferase RsmG [Sedimentitalea sp. JM2-8]|uniref:Ribosomal RNA small subunit methyltransferase G n=1 Tax=Sedimentitalea xiamensis TaxID=3050037 RepID=A0ABT7F9J3_9RHOB|nr:16S rRNA (guanine(527)-N(7))-methyltransferase RsmG [Sedimentitalea xiamensis]MDK3071777.1 16S rRNA (guanine(527)-N(7))-methyltransferase RsmG [Sedimentitalea xiamensis]